MYMIGLTEESGEKRRVVLPAITCGPDPGNLSICFFNNWKKTDLIESRPNIKLTVDRSFSYEKNSFLVPENNEVSMILEKYKNTSAIFETNQLEEETIIGRSPYRSIRKKNGLKDHYRRKIFKTPSQPIENSIDGTYSTKINITASKPEWRQIEERFKNNIGNHELAQIPKTNESSSLLLIDKIPSKSPTQVDEENDVIKKSIKFLKYVPVLENKKVIKSKLILSNLKSQSTANSPRREKTGTSSTTATPRVDTQLRAKDPNEKLKNLRAKLLFLDSNPFLNEFEIVETSKNSDKNNNIRMLKSVFESRPPTLFIPYPKNIKIQNDENIFVLKPKNNQSISVKFGTDYEYKVIPDCLKNGGLTQSYTNDWNIFWGRLPPADVIDRMKWYQKINHYPGSRNLGRKDSLWRNYNRLRQRFPSEYNYMPTTYLMDTDFDMFMYKQKNANQDDLWILKPVASSCGNGISIVGKSTRISKKNNYLISEYIANPHLINGLKYDLRIYALVSSVDPLRIYLYDEGLVRFATSPYSKEAKSLGQRNRHLTNYAINKFAPEYQPNLLYNEESSSKWSLKLLKKKYKEMGIDYDVIKDGIKDIIIKSIISAEPFMLQGSMRSHNIDKKCFELYGFDILIDENLKPWLMEVNSSPSLNTDSKFDELVKTKLICDVINLIGLKVPGCEIELEKDEEMHNMKHFRRNVKYLMDLTPELANEMLAPMDWQILFESEEELYRTGSFEPIFPLQENVENYRSLFEIQRYNNILLWKFKSFSKNILETITKIANNK